MKASEIFRADSKYRAFLASIFAFALAYGLYKGVIDNYLAEIVGMSEFDKGVSEFFREMPGLMLVFLLALLYEFSAEKIYKLGSVIMLLGMGMQALVPATRVLVTLAIFTFSLGEHIQLGMKSTLSLVYAKPGHGGVALGCQSAVFQFGTLAGFGAVVAVFWLLGRDTSLFRPIFGVSTLMVFLGMLISWQLTSNTATDATKRRFYFNRKYTKYYMLEVFYGARKQIFFTFGPYVLVLFYGASAMAISVLFAVAAICSFVASPVVGRIIDRLGYKVVMVADTLILVLVCFCYGFAHHLFPKEVAFYICCVNYVLDAVISLAAMASNVYVQDLSESVEETRATISTGVSVNHLITILIALFGGWIWHKLGIETLFMLSAVLGLCNSAYAATIRSPKRAAKG
ncbi:MAG: MFS transporter [Victivallales bacterium]|nr:MFS transporter [Victivallales bacterium]